MSGTPSKPSPRWQHAPFAVVLAVGIVLRWIDWRAYRPALLFPDSVHYLSDALTGQLNVRRPSGYSFVFGPFIRSHDIALVSLAQHLLMLGIAVLLYVFLLRREVPAWGAALASIPLLWDPLQLILEQYILSDVLFEALVTLGCVVLLWRRRPLLVDVFGAGLILGYAQIVRGAGTGMVIPAVVALIALRVGWRKVVVLVVAFVVPLVAYMFAFHQQEGVWGTNTFSSRYLYGRVTTFVHCGRISLPQYERPLCPKLPVDDRPSSDWYMWEDRSPQKHFTAPPGLTEVQVLHDFDQRAIRAQPVAFGRIVARDFIVGFHPSRAHSVPGFPPGRWLFHRYYWSLGDSPHQKSVFQQMGFWPPTVDRGYMTFMTQYQQAFHVPGPLLLIAVFIGAAACAGIGRARRSGHRVACGLFVGACLMSLLTTAALSGFSWRYQLPQLALLGPAAALGLTALLRRPHCGLPSPDATGLRQLTAKVLRRPASDGSVRAAEPWVGATTALVVGILIGAAAYATRWATMEFAGLIALLTFFGTSVPLLTSRWRGLPDDATRPATADVAD